MLHFIEPLFYTLMPPNLETAVPLTPADLAQFLLTNGHLDKTYLPEKTLWFKAGTSASWVHMTHLHLFSTNNHYSLHVQLSDQTSVLFTADYQLPSSIHADNTCGLHPLLATAPDLPPYLHKPNTPFYSNCHTQLTLPQSHIFLHSITAELLLPANAFHDWTAPVNLAISRTWPTPEAPLSTRVVFFYAAQKHEQRFYCDIPTPTALLEHHPQYFTLHQNVLLSLLLSQLMPNPDPLANPWLLVQIKRNKQDRTWIPSLFSNPYHTPALCASFLLSSLGLLLHPNPSHTQPPWLNTPLSDIELNSLCLQSLSLSTIFQQPDPLRPCASSLIADVQTALQSLYDKAALSLLTC